jgi:hypothetical protein
VNQINSHLNLPANMTIGLAYRPGNKLLFGLFIKGARCGGAMAGKLAKK